MKFKELSPNQIVCKKKEKREKKSVIKLNFSIKSYSGASSESKRYVRAPDLQLLKR